METNLTRSQTGRMIPTLGFFVSRLGSYYETIWNAITQVAKEYNAQVICFVGGELNSLIGFQKHWNVIYDLVSPANVDGLIVPSAGLQNYATVEEMTQFCARYTPLPVISIGQKLESIPSITIDNFVGLREVMKHLIEQHNCQRIAFVRGPETNPEAEARYRAYVESLENHGIPFDPDLVVQGNFNFETGVEAVNLLLDQRKVDFKAVVASNDSMAFGAWQELTRRGFKIPVDMVVTGFDDAIEARNIATPLTTVRQPIV